MNKFTIQGKMKQVNATILAPENSGLRFVLNACGQSGKFESKLDNLLTKRWVKVREDYKGWYATQHNFKLGWLNNTAVASDTWVINMLVEDKDGKVDEKALQLAVKKLAELAKYEKASVHVSTILTAEIPALQPMLVKGLIEEGVNVYFYNEPIK
jgi:hypothetical protein